MSGTEVACVPLFFRVDHFLPLGVIYKQWGMGVTPINYYHFLPLWVIYKQWWRGCPHKLLEKLYLVNMSGIEVNRVPPFHFLGHP